MLEALAGNVHKGRAISDNAQVSVTPSSDVRDSKIFY